VFVEECSKIVQDGNELPLIGMDGEIEYILKQMDGISDNDDIRSIYDLNNLINPTSDSK